MSLLETPVVPDLEMILGVVGALRIGLVERECELQRGFCACVAWASLASRS